MKLSDAIRAGSKLAPQRYGLRGEGTCVLQAAAAGIGFPLLGLTKVWPCLRRHDLALIEKNDVLKMSRESIADWLDSYAAEHGIDLESVPVAADPAASAEVQA